MVSAVCALDDVIEDDVHRIGRHQPEVGAGALQGVKHLHRPIGDLIPAPRVTQVQ
jgi:hypothetical protein